MGFAANEQGIDAIRQCIDGLDVEIETLKQIGDSLEGTFDSCKQGLGDNFDSRIEMLIELVKMGESGVIASVENLVELLDDMAGYYVRMLEYQFTRGSGRQR